MTVPDPELINEENPEWTDEDFARAMPFSALPVALQQFLSSEKLVVPDAVPSAMQPPAA
jgi:hypothetical protein